MRIAICEDETYWIDTLQADIMAWASSKGIEIDIDSFLNPTALIEGIILAPFDLLFLDIAFGEAYMDGMETAGYIRKTGNKIPIVFVTSDAFRADEGYLVEAMGYLRKPIEKNKLTLFLDRALKGVKPVRMIEITTSNGITIIPHNDIIYAEVIDKVINCHTYNGVITFRETISHFLERLGHDDFMQVHRAYLIAKNKIHGVKPTYPFNVTLLKGIETVEVPLSKQYIDRVLDEYAGDVLRRMG